MSSQLYVEVIYIISSSIFASTVIGVNNISFLTSIQTIITL